MSADGPAAGRPRWSLSPPAVLGSLVALVTVGMAQPLLDLLGRNAAFLVAHDVRRVDVVAIAVVLPVLAPAVLGLAVLGLARVHRGAAAVVHAALVVGLGAALALVILRLGGAGDRIPGALAVAVALGAGAALAAAYRSSTALRRVMAVAALAAPVVAAVFLFATPARALVLPSGPAQPLPGLDEDRPPIVMVIFDELPLASLLDADRRIDADAFPAFARLADDATFFRNFTAVHGQTSDLLPAILSGMDPRPDTLPITSDHPRNLFALLEGGYDLHVEEPLTELCPVGSCVRASGGGGTGHYRALVRDLAIVGAHLVVPEDLAGGLPPIDHGWRDFAAAVEEADKEIVFRDRFREVRDDHPRRRFDAFLAGLRPGDRPTLHFLHLLLPHGPWRYLPDGREYPIGDQPGLERGRWVADEWQAAQGYQRHLLQLRYTDLLLGRLLDRLEDQGLYDDALLVVMADHGASFRADTSLRVIAADTLPEIAPVPLLVKAPEQREGAVSDAALESVDVLPTVLDVLGASSPGTDGRSAFDAAVAERSSRRFFTDSGPLTFTAAPGLEAPVVQRKLDLMTRSRAFSFPYGLAPAGFADLLGTTAASAVPATTPRVVLDDPGAYADVDPGADVVPAHVTGQVLHDTLPTERTALAVRVNGTIAAVTLEDPNDGLVRGFRAHVPPELLRDGANTVEVVPVDRGAG